MKIIAVVPTFNRPECLLKNISCLLAQQTQLDSIIIVNNGSDQSTEDTLQAAGFLRNKKIRYIRLNKNIGASGGFSSGMKAAIDDSADWVWGMDDDAFPEPDALQALLQVLSPTEKLCYWSNVDEDISFDHPVKQVNGLIFVGFLISQKLISDIGYPDQRFFMYHDDTEYSQRINRAGYQILKVRDSKIRHLGYNKRGTPIKEINLYFKKIKLLTSSPYRMYYIYRNEFFIKDTRLKKLEYLLKTALIDFPKYLIFRPKTGMSILYALIHILRNKRGESSLPEYFFN